MNKVSCIGMGSVVGLAFALGGCSSSPMSSGSDAVTTQAMQQAMSPDDVIRDLQRGNERFLDQRLTERAWLGQVRATASGQYPKAIVLSCLDSRVPPELIFDQGIGDIFVGRVAGNFENVDMLGSMEFGTAAAGSKAIVVLGHSACGAVKGAIDDVKLGNLTETLANIQPAVMDASRGRARGTSGDTAFVDAVVEANVRRTVADIQSRSPVIADRVASGQLKVVGAVYDLETGRVTWLDG
ncbi:MAG: carbonic anhydrase family protein [Phycisphaerales bacterium]